MRKEGRKEEKGEKEARTFKIAEVRLVKIVGGDPYQDM